jgi:hypothetical protein
MRIFDLNNQYRIVCDWQKTSNGFKHIATLLHKNGCDIAKTKICYLNRTWERFEYESILTKIIEDNFKDKELIKFLEVIKNLN